MRCLACGAEMRLEQVAGDDTVPVPGFERHTFVCSDCGDIEQRLVFTRDVGPSHTGSIPLHAAPSISPSSTVESKGAAVPGVVRRIFAKLWGIRRAVERRLIFSHGTASRSTVSVPTPPDTSAPPFQPVSVPEIPPTSLRPAEPEAVPTVPPTTVPPTSVSSETDNDLDECEALLRHAIEIVQGPTRSSQIKTNLTETRSAPPAKVINSMRAERSPTSRVVVQIHYDPEKAKYVAKDTKSGLRVLRHQDSARLRAMCDRMGWQVVDGAVNNAGD
jgi:hypothetical protein